MNVSVALIPFSLIYFFNFLVNCDSALIACPKRINKWNPFIAFQLCENKCLYIDATYIRVEGRWCYLYRAIDKEGNLVDVYLSDVRDQTAAERFFRQAQQTTGVIPIQITTDKEPALYPAIKKVFSEKTKHRDSKYINNILESDHRVTKSRLSIMKGFKNIFCALKFCTVFEEVRQFFRIKNILI